MYFNNVCMEARLPPLNKNKKGIIHLTNLTFFTELWDINSVLRGGGTDMFSELWKFISHNYEKKSQNCEIKSCNNLFILYSVAETGLHMSVHGKWLVTRNYDLLVQENFMEKI